MSPQRTTGRRGVALGAALVLVATGAVGAAAAPATAASPDVVISEVYGGGGNSGALLKQDFIELYNRGDAPVDVTGWSVQYASSTGTFNVKTDLAGTIEPGAFYLVGQGFGAGGSVDLPTTDASGSIAMSGTGAKVALVTDGTLLPCGSDCDTYETVRDFIGWGTSANDFEGTRAVATSNPTSLTRSATGADTDDNLADFTLLEPPLPTNSAGETPDYGGDPVPCDGATPTAATVPEIQGAGHLSALDGDCVVTSGVVTATKFDGYWVQDVEGDGSTTTSDGVFVFTTAGGQKPAVGDVVDVTGFVDEYRAATTALALTEIVDSDFEVTGTGAALPDPVIIGGTGALPPVQTIDDDSASRIDIETAGSYDPAGDAIDFYEQLEGMIVGIEQPQVVGPTTVNGELPLVPTGRKKSVRTVAGGIAYGSYEKPNPTRVIANDEIIFQQMPAANTGDSLVGTVTGPLSYSFNNFKLELTEVPTVLSGGLERDVAKAPKEQQLAVATFNVENLSPVDPQAKFDALAEIIVDNLRSPDILALEEVQDNSGPVSDGTVAADETLDLLVAAISAAGGPAYSYAQIDPEDGEDGGQPGGNIRVAFLYDTSRGLAFVQTGEGDATTPTEVVDDGGEPALTLSPGRVDPLNPAWESTRKPLVGEFTHRGEKLFVIANHFSSKGGDEPLFGRFQPPTRSSEAARHEQAASVNAFVDELLAVDPSTNVVVAGDINDFEFSETIDILTAGGTALADLIRYKLPKKRWTYVFDGNSQVLDHLLVGGGLHPDQPGTVGKPVNPKTQYEVVHVNADFADQVSDHDPQVVRVRLG